MGFSRGVGTEAQIPEGWQGRCTVSLNERYNLRLREDPAQVAHDCLDRDPDMPIRPHPTLLSDFTARRRVPTRPVAARGPTFAADFDDDTLFFDAFRSADGRHAVLIGPPLFDLAEVFGAARIFDRAGGPALPFTVKRRDRQVQVWVRIPREAAGLRLVSAIGTVEIAIGANLSDRFAGRRVLTTLSRDNPLPWICDWVRFNRDVNGADAVLIYDNRSTTYDTAALRDALGRLRGLAAVEVVDWPFRYGPQGLDAWRYWDSDFCQLGMLEHARWRFLARARSAMNADVDELPLGTASPFAAAERSLLGVVRYAGRLVVETGEGPSAPVAERRHHHYGTVLRRQPGRGRLGLPVDRAAERAKWTAVPRRCPPWAQWHVHSIKRWLWGAETRRTLGHRHFKPLTTSWKYDREGVVRFDPAVHEADAALAGAMARVDWER